MFRQRYDDMEKVFSELSSEESTHPVVMRQELDWIPSSVPSFLQYPVVRVRPFDRDDKAARTRILRDRYRAFLHPLNHKLSGLVQDYRRIQVATIERLPFLHLWHLFKPGQEMITTDPKIEAYHVSQVTGGRKLMLKNQDRFTQKARMSNLMIDCFRCLAFDGQKFGLNQIIIKIRPYESSKAIRQLPAFSLDLAAKPHLSEELTERGNKFENFRRRLRQATASTTGLCCVETNLLTMFKREVLLALIAAHCHVLIEHSVADFSVLAPY